MLRFAKFITKVNLMLFQISKWIIFLIVPIMLYEVISRYAFDSPTLWATELSTLLFGPYFLFGGPYLLHGKGHVAVDVVYEKLSLKNRLVCDLIAILLCMSFSIIMFYFALPQSLNSYLLTETSFSAWNPIIWPFKMALPVAAALLLLQAIAELILLFKTSINSKNPSIELIR